MIGIISAQRTAKANWGSRWRWARNPVLKMNALTGAREIDRDWKRLNRKEVLGPGRTVVGQVGKKAHCLLVAEGLASACS